MHLDVPPNELKSKIYYCGFHSGHQADKFKETGLTPRPTRKVKAPIIDECVAHMECKVKQQIETGDKNLFIGEVVEACADEFLARWERKIKYAMNDFRNKYMPRDLKPHSILSPEKLSLHNQGSFE